ncbi:MAG: hypothetical protein L6R41_004756 [Letrouitia leprolyta]|nr:MAG: hypothetical protein L6R41_004756 [Letrouitia leprolyta]
MAKFGSYTVDFSNVCHETPDFQRIERQLCNDSFKEDAQASGGRPFPFSCLNLEYSAEDGVHHFYSKEQQRMHQESFCHKLYNAVIDPKDHLSRLDTLFSQIVKCNFIEFDKPEKVAAETSHLLNRLPASPVKLPNTSKAHDYAYFIDGSSSQADSVSVSWDDLQVVAHVSTNVIRVALMVAMYGTTASGTLLGDFIDITAKLISTASGLAASAVSDDEKYRWFLVRAFLWSSWQRSTMLYFYSRVGAHVQLGFDDGAGQEVVRRGFYPMAGMSIQEMSKRFTSVEKPAYMCGWAFELIRTDPCAIGLDFRYFFQRFSDAFEGREGRCIPHEQDSCKGDAPDTCQRFRGMKIENQSAHHDDCRGDCGRLIWNKASYISITGPRAVVLDESNDQDQLNYRQALDRTLAISHVWSHGQGGRPEEGHGLNRCLHRRYVLLAKSLGCDSYWMDTPCIPEDHKLRREAILKINEIFENSRATLVCDRDLMSIDAANLSVETRETILVTAMVCDWNLRAWTFLEAVRGRRNVYILCKDNVIVSLREMTEIVYRKGRIDIVILLLTAPHLQPIRYGREYKTVGDSFVSGFMTLETGASLLSHREASRPGDDIVIWSLLLDDKVYNKAKKFWRSKVGQSIFTSFLFSSAPRLNIKGFRWAPSSPTAHLLADQSNGSKYRLLAYDGNDSSSGLITKDGYRAAWLMYDFVGGARGSALLSSKMEIEMEPVEPRCKVNLDRIRRKFLRWYLWGALLQPIASQSYNDPVLHRSDAGRTLLAVVATNRRWTWPGEKDKRLFWTWRGVYEWDMSEPLPEFATVENVYIV